MFSNACTINPFPVFKFIAVKIDETCIEFPLFREEAFWETFFRNKFNSINELLKMRGIRFCLDTSMKNPFRRVIVIEAGELPVPKPVHGS